MIEGRDRGRNRIGEAALFPDLAEQPRGEPGAAAEHLREHDAGDVVGVLARHGGPAETDRRLRHVEIDDLDPAEAGERRLGDGYEIAARGQIGEDVVEEPRRALGLDRADDADMRGRRA